MSQPTDYDSTLARIAGNIAAGLAPLDGHDADKCAKAVRMAQTIIGLCRADAEEKRAESITANQREYIRRRRALHIADPDNPQAL